MAAFVLALGGSADQTSQKQPKIATETDGMLPSLRSECREGGVNASRTPTIAWPI